MIVSTGCTMLGKRLVAMVGALVLVSASANADVLGTYNFNSGSVSATGVVTGVTFSTFTRGAGAAVDAVTDKFGSDGFTGNNMAAAITNNDYVTFTVTPLAGYRLSLDTFVYDRSAGGGAGSDYLLSSRGAGFVSTGSLGTLSSGSAKQLTLSGTFDNTLDTTIFRIYGYGDSNSSKNHTLDNVVMQGSTQSMASLSTTSSNATGGRYFKGQTASIGLGVSNDALATGTLATEQLNYSANLAGASGMTMSAINVSNLAGGSFNAHSVTVDTTATGLKSGTLNINSSNAWRTNSVAGTKSTTVSLSAAVVDSRTINADSVNFGRLMANSTANVSQNVNLTTTGDGNNYTSVTVLGSAVATDANGVSIAAGSNALFNGAGSTASRSMALVKALGSSTGPVSGTIGFARQSAENGGAGLSGEVVKPINVNYQYTVVANRSISATPLALGDVLVNRQIDSLGAAALTSTLSSPGADDHYTRVTVAGNSSGDGLSANRGGGNLVFNGAAGGQWVLSGAFATAGNKSGFALGRDRRGGSCRSVGQSGCDPADGHPGRQSSQRVRAGQRGGRQPRHRRRPAEHRQRSRHRSGGGTYRDHLIQRCSMDP